MDFKNWLLEQQSFGGRMGNRVFQYPKRATRGAYSAVLSNVRDEMGGEGKYLGRGRSSMFDPYETPTSNEIADRMVGYAPRNDQQGNPRLQRQIVVVARKELRERLQVGGQFTKLIQAIARREVFIKFVAIDETYDWALEHDPTAQQHQEAGDAAVVFKFVKRGNR